jgi:predicted O-methyltransferase YrrM
MQGTEIGDELDLVVDGVRFVSGWSTQDHGDAFTLVKSAQLVARYERLLAGFDRPRMVELGIRFGGSAAFFTLRARPRKLVAVEFEPTPSAQLDRFVRARGLTETVRPYYGVDQGDRQRVSDILADEFGDEELDLVVDDASHRYGPTLASYETIFPRLRTGGLYVVEDWAGQHGLAAALARRLADEDPARRAVASAGIGRRLDEGGAPVPLSRLVVELMLVEAGGAAIVDEVCVTPHWIAVRRGPARLDPGAFRLADHYDDHFGMVRP